MVAEIRDGTLLGDKARDPQPERARELEAIANKSGTLRPIDVWPNLRFVSSWSGSYLRRYAAVMEEAFCGGFFPQASASSECCITMPVDADRVGNPLYLLSALFEFVPVESEVTARAETLQYHELEVDRSYEVILTTFGGLYRYAMCDTYRVIELLGEVPRLEYVGRRSVSDLTGEKLAEQQVVDATREILPDHGLAAVNFTLCAVQSEKVGERPRYVLVVECPRDWQDERSRVLAKALDDRFRSVNSRYALKRSFFDIDSVEVQPVGDGTFHRYRQLLVRRGAPGGQVKDKILHAAGGPVLTDLLGASAMTEEGADG
jgi:hypothetical protein